jgi:hypothetical protein
MLYRRTLQANIGRRFWCRRVRIICVELATHELQRADPHLAAHTWVESVTLTESAAGERHQERHQDRRLDIRVRLLGAHYDGHLELMYSDVASYSFDGSSLQRGHGDWLRDESRLSEDGFVLHEVVFGCSRDKRKNRP